VLVVGGNGGFRRDLGRQLGAHVARVAGVDDDASALPALVGQAPAALILVDHPPRVDAVGLARRLRAHAALRRTPMAVLAPWPLGERDEPLDADRFSIDAGPAELAAWLTARLPIEPTPDEQLRDTLARATGDGAGHVEGPDGTEIDWVGVFERLPTGAAVVDADGLVVAANADFADAVGAPSTDACLAQPLLSLLPEPPTPAEGRSDRRPTLTVILGRDERAAPVDLTFAAAGPAPSRYVVVTVTDQRWRTAAIEAQAANHDLTEQLRRSQKIGALGRLAGGVAHDFNNLLQVIGGYAESLGSEGLDPTARRRLLQRIQRATDRAASLTRQLLAFGRRQVLVPQVLDLNVTVLSLEHMLTRVIGEDVQFLSSLAPDLMRVKVDPGQVEQVLLNLALNARDAMTSGGTLEIATANFRLDADWHHPALPVPVPAGTWVLLSVVDTGCGMDPETAAQAFEPFFTTKDSSRGSGLGLSMVYGIVKQSGGFTWIESAPGAGTSVHLLLPAAQDDAVVAPRGDVEPAASDVSRGGTVLLVEDDPEVRSLFSTFLRGGGYAVHEAGDGEEALHIFERHADEIDVVMTDVVMPNVSGPSLASALRARKPDVRVLFVSGYTDQVEVQRDDPLAGHMAKPVTRGDLLVRVAELMGQGR
jgi:two-component system, cell cycle sensor histidine kinase and response regulator CckA